LLGATFDIHGGGNDLQFPHHENEIAQSKCAHPEGGFARYWLHNEMLQVEGRKMSKSLGNFFTVRDLLDQGVPGEVIRFVMLGTHYRKPMDWTEKKRVEAEYHLGRWFSMTENVEPDLSSLDYIISPLKDDLNTSGVFSRLHTLAQAGRAGALRAGIDFLGLGTPENAEWFQGKPIIVSTVGGPQHAVRPYLVEWNRLREARDFEAADRYKSKLEAHGLKLSVSKGGVEAEVPADFDPSKLEGLE